MLKPELEHLRSQLTHQKDVLAEKLALERQLNTLEVELANEKRAAQRAAHKQDSDNQAEQDLRKRVRELEKELAKEKRAAEKNEVENEVESLREQLEGMKTNLGAEKRKVEQLTKSQTTSASEMQEELEQLRQSLEETKKALAAEKRATQRQAKKEASASNEEVAQLREELEAARKELADQKKAQEKLQKEYEQAQVDAEERQQAAFDKVDRMRNKLRDTREELKKCQAELEKALERATKHSSVATTTVPLKSAGAKANAKKKKPVDEMSMDDKVLLTPGNMDDRPKRPVKKRGFDPSMVGGKSEFSITPFLNKTVNVDESPKPAAEDATPTAAVQSRGAKQAAAVEATEGVGEEPATGVASAPEPPATALVEKRPRGRPRTKPLSDSSPSTKNLTAASRKATRVESTLEKVTEEQDETDSSTNQDQENRSSSSAGSEPPTKTTTTATTITTATTTSGVPEKVEPKKKKRKLLGANPTTLFDGGEDEGERVKPIATAVNAAAAAKRPVAGKVGGVKAIAKGPVAAARFGAGVKNAFGGTTFSPLKREKRGVAASFLA